MRVPHIATLVPDEHIVLLVAAVADAVERAMVHRAAAAVVAYQSADVGIVVLYVARHAAEIH